jgi:hypothetical protein
VIFLLLNLDDAQLLFAFVAISVALGSKVLVDIPTAASMQLDIMIDPDDIPRYVLLF